MSDPVPLDALTAAALARWHIVDPADVPESAAITCSHLVPYLYQRAARLGLDVAEAVLLDDALTLEGWLHDERQRGTPPSAPHDAHAHRPIWWGHWRGEGCALAGYVYTLDGQDYTSEEAAAMVTANSENLWTWRRADDGHERV